MGRSLRSDLSIFLALAVVTPLMVSAIVLLLWANLERSAHTEKAVQLRLDINMQLLSIFNQTEKSLELVQSSREFHDFILAPPETRTYSENLLYGRLDSIKKENPFIEFITIRNQGGDLLYSDRDLPLPIQSGVYNLSGGAVVVALPVNLDDQYQSNGHTTIKATILASMPLAGLIKAIDRLESITSITPGKPPSLQFKSIPLSENYRYIYSIIGALLIVLIVGVCAGLVILNRFLIGPLKGLTSSVHNRSLTRAPAVLPPTHELEVLRQTLLEYDLKVRASAQSEAIAQTAQMLAHDVRKPFSMIRGIIEILSHSQGRWDQKKINGFVCDVERAMKRINAMIADVLEIDSRSDLLLASLSPRQLILESLFDQANPATEQTAIATKFEHKHCVHVDSVKMQRVLANIVTNALQATGPNGDLWFYTQECEGMLTLTIGNSGSFIPDEDLENIFSAFYTRNKRTGTGLGLAIAQKIVERHEGKIWCTSSLEEGTEFHISLPVTSEFDQGTVAIPSRLGETSALGPTPGSGGRDGTELYQDAFLQTQLKNCLSSTSNEKIRILICDDEAVYRSMLIEYLIDEVPEKLFEVFECASGQEALETTASHDPHLIIMDIDLGEHSADGIETASQIKCLTTSAVICMHSNRGIMLNHQTSAEIGAHLFIPKPMSKIQFLRLVLESSQRFDSQHQDYKACSKILVIDDDPWVAECWRQAHPEVEVEAHYNPKEFIQALKSGRQVLDFSTIVVLDYFFDGDLETTGLDIAQAIRDQQFKNKIYLSSDAEVPSQALDKLRVEKVAKGLVKL